MLIYIFFNLSTFDFSSNKIQNIDFSTDIRLTRGYYTFINLPFISKIIGVGFYNLYNFLLNNNLYFSWIFGSLIPEYTTGISAILVYFGLVPFVIFLIMLFKHIKLYKNNKYKIMLIGTVIILMSIQTSLFNVWFVFIWGIYLFYIKENI